MLSFIWGRLTDEWFATSRAFLLFFVCSILTLALVPVFLGRISGREASRWLELFWGTIGVLGAPATLFLWIGMWRYWARLDRSSRWAKRLWFTVLLIGFWYGSVLYCYLVYLPQIRGKARQRNWHCC